MSGESITASRYPSIRALFTIAALAGALIAGAADDFEVVLARGSVWRYFDGSASPGATWMQSAFNDSAWSNGPALLGYGDSDVVTTISYGTNSANKRITSYYRQTVVLSNAAALTGARFDLLRDDGAIVYLNGAEICRNNMPAGAVAFNTPSAGSGSDDELTYFKVYLEPASLLAGTNLLAVEIHQQKPDTSDSRFDGAFLVRTNPAPLLGEPSGLALSPTNALMRVALLGTGGGTTSLRLFWGPVDGTNNATAWASNANLGPQATGLVSSVVSNLPAGRRTYFRFRATNSGGTAWGDASAVVITPPQTVTVVSTGSVWRFLDDGSDPGGGWVARDFDDSLWGQGPAQLGYSPDELDEQTTVGYGGNPTNKYITTFFRHRFVVADPAPLQNLRVELLRDDGAIVYLNGQEVVRDNMPVGLITNTTLASVNVSSNAESTFYMHNISGLLVAGTNVLAVEIHQVAPNSSDISFDLALKAAGTVAPALTRGPYLQSGTPTALTFRWRTDFPTNSVVWWGLAPSALTEMRVVPGARTEHSVTETNLTPSTRYYYAIGTSSETLAGGDPNHTFVTAPIPGTPLRTRIWAIGDSGTADSAARAVFESYERLAGTDYTHVWLMLGDNAYLSGTDAQYQSAVFDMYPRLLRKTVLWSTLGNHETYNGELNSALEIGPYYDIFTFPRAGEAGGLASGTEAYYSFDYANIHFVCLDAMDMDRSAGGAMLTWLANDLAMAQQEWVVAFWHHPPYTKGSHNSDTEVELIEMRANALPILESYGVDLVLCGHSHVYERSYYLKGHFGLSTTLNTNTMFVDGGDGRLDGDGAYGGTATGTVYVVCGSSGALAGSTFGMNHPAMYISLVVNGSLVLDVDGRQLTLRFIDAVGLERDRFTLEHGDSRSADSDNDQLPDWWEWWHFKSLAHDGTFDLDDDGVNDADELAAGTDPNADTSFLQISDFAPVPGGKDLSITWPGEPGRHYVVRTATNLAAGAAWDAVAETNSPLLRGPLTTVIPSNPAVRGYFKVEAQFNGM